jgi:hypothetical protein
VRLSVEGRVGLMDRVYGYGHAAYLPALEDVRSVDTEFRDVTGYEYEFGVAWNVMLHMSLRAGYRADSVDYTEPETVLTGGGTAPSKIGTGGNSGIGIPGGPSPGSGGQAVNELGDGSTESKGFFVGLGFRF